MPSNPYTGVHQPSPYSPEAQGLDIPTVWTDDEAKPVWTPEEARAALFATDEDTDAEPVTFANGTRMVPLRKLTTETMHDTSVTTTDRLYVHDGRVARASVTLPGVGMGEIRATPLPSGHRVEEVTLEVPVSHGKLTYALGAVDAVIAGRRAFGYTIPEESRTVTTVGNEIIIRWEEHS